MSQPMTVEAVAVVADGTSTENVAALLKEALAWLGQMDVGSASWSEAEGLLNQLLAAVRSLTPAEEAGNVSWPTDKDPAVVKVRTLARAVSRLHAVPTSMDGGLQRKTQRAVDAIHRLVVAPVDRAASDGQTGATS